MKRHWLVTGGAGFIGSTLVELLLHRGDSVTVLDDFSTGSMANLPLRHDRLTLIQGNVCSADDLDLAIQGVSGVFHCAATVAVQDCINDWIGAHQANLTATIRLFEAAQRHGARPVVYASSSAVYGDRSEQVCHEELTERPISPYGADKLSCEHQARAFWHVHGLPSAGLRFFNVYGPRQNFGSPYSGVLVRFCHDRMIGRTPVIFGDGGQSRDFIHVDDVVSGMVAAMDLIGGQPQCLVSNVCTGRSVTLLELLAVIDRSRGVDGPRPRFQTARLGDIRHSMGHPGRMEQWLGIQETRPLERGVREYWDWLNSEYRTTGEALAPQTATDRNDEKTSNTALSGHAQLGV